VADHPSQPTGERAGEVFTDSAGVTARYTPVSEIRPGDVLLVGWRSTIARVDHQNRCWRLWTEGNDKAPATPWVSGDRIYPIEVVKSDA
jgi:hypothetical protein